MANTTGDQPAFPLFAYVDKEDHSFQEGMSKREYFAAMAPAEIPDWFVHSCSSKKPNLPLVNELVDEEHRQEVIEWQRDPCYDLPEELRWFQEKVEKASKAIMEWEKENTTQRYFQWRCFYAEQLIKALNQSPDK
jgi:hypothetical protein